MCVLVCQSAFSLPLNFAKHLFFAWTRCITDQAQTRTSVYILIDEICFENDIQCFFFASVPGSTYHSDVSQSFPPLKAPCFFDVYIQHAFFLDGDAFSSNAVMIYIFLLGMWHTRVLLIVKSSASCRCDFVALVFVTFTLFSSESLFRTLLSCFFSHCAYPYQTANVPVWQIL